MKYLILTIITLIFIGCGSSSSSKIEKESTTTPPQPKVTDAGVKPPASPEL
jgi:hypothetical protein